MTNYEIKRKLKKDLESYADKARINKDLSEATGYTRSHIYQYWKSYAVHLKIEEAAVELLSRYKAETAERVKKIELA